MKLYKTYNTLMVIVFIVCIFTPLVMVNKTPGRISVAENRALAQFPSLSDPSNNKLNRSFPGQFQTWFNDNLGFRERLVQANTLLQYNLFNRITRPNTVLGKNDWLYLMYPDMIRTYQNINLPNEERIEDFKSTFGNLKEYFNKKNIPFLTMIAPDKETIYPEHMPDSINRTGSISKTDVIMNELSKDGLNIFSPKNSLIKSKEYSVLYSQNFDLSHWNEKGAFIGYLELMEKITQIYPNLKKMDWEDFEIEQYNRSSKIYGVLPFTEIDYKMKYKKPYEAKKDTNYLNFMQLSDPNLVYRYTNEFQPNAPKLLIIGDSFTYMFMLQNLAESFSELTFVHWSNMGQIKNIVNYTTPDLFVFQLMEPALDQFLDSIRYSDNYFADVNVSLIPNKGKLLEGTSWIDYVNDIQPLNQNSITIDFQRKDVKISGWALDVESNKPAGGVFLKIGDEYYEGIYGIPHNGVKEFFKNESFLKSGFVFNIPVEVFNRNDSFELIVISNDGSYKYDSKIVESNKKN